MAKIAFNPKPIHENCKGCNKVNEADQTCVAYENPTAKWEPKPGATLAPGVFIACPLASHFDAMPAEVQQKINPLKASKRAAGGGGKKKKR
jgi:hypothetical protein